jgi:hypothetical protein
MILKASEFKFPEAIRAKFYMIVRATPPEGWPRGPVIATENRVPYKNFLQIVGSAPNTEFEVSIGEYEDHTNPRIILSMLEEISLNCPLIEDEAETIRVEYSDFVKKTDEDRPVLFVQGLISPLFYAFETGMVSFASALTLSLYVGRDTQREIVRLNSMGESPEVVLKNFADPFYAGDLLNRLAREPGRLKGLGHDNLRTFLRNGSPFSYGRSRFLMRLAAAIPVQNRASLTSDHGELLLQIGQKKRAALFRGERILIDGEEFDLRQLTKFNRDQARKLIRSMRKEQRGTQA